MSDNQLVEVCDKCGVHYQPEFSFFHECILSDIEKQNKIKYKKLEIEYEVAKLESKKSENTKCEHSDKEYEEMVLKWEANNFECLRLVKENELLQESNNLHKELFEEFKNKLTTKDKMLKVMYNYLLQNFLTEDGDLNLELSGEDYDAVVTVMLNGLQGIIEGGKILEGFNETSDLFLSLAGIEAMKGKE